MTHYYLDILLSIFVAMVGVELVITGFLGILRRRPSYNIQQGWPVIQYIFFFLFWTILLASFGIQYLEINAENIPIEEVFIVIIISALLSFLVGILPRIWGSKPTASVTIYGINRKVLDLLRQALTKEGIAYREIHEDFGLSKPDATIYTSLWSALGYASLKIDPKENLPVLEKIIQNMKAYDLDHNDHFAIIFMILQVLVGLVLFIIGLIIAYLFLQIVII